MALGKKLLGCALVLTGLAIQLPAYAGTTATVITGLRVTGWTQNTVGLAWDAAPGGTQPWTYWVRMDSITPEIRTETRGGTVFANLASGPAGVHRLSVVGLDGANRQASSDRAVSVDTRLPFADTTAPSTPTGFQASAILATSVWTRWPAITDNSGDVLNFEVSDDGGSTWLKAFRFDHLGASASTLQFAGLTPGTRRTLAVRAVDGAGLRSAPATISVTTADAADRTAPTAPGNFRQSGGALLWDASTDDSGAARYQLHLADDPRLVVSQTLLTHFPAGTTSIGISDLVNRCFLSPGTSYTVNLRAVDPTGNLSAASRTITFTA